MKLTPRQQRDYAESLTRHGAERVTEAEVTEMVRNVELAEGQEELADDKDIGTIAEMINELAGK